MKRITLSICLMGLLLIVAACSNDSPQEIEDPQQQEVEASCNDGIQNGDETGLDCGGSCAPCLSSLDLQGTAQKGPFINGSSVLLSELLPDFTASGRTFSSQISNNLGSFEFDDLALASNTVTLRVDGFYFNEVCGVLSNAQITLNGIVNLRPGIPVNLNVLTHLEKARVESLLDTGIFFNEAKAQAQQEILNIFNITPSSDIEASEILDLSGSTEGDAILIAVSSILQGYRDEASFSTMMAQIISDIRDDGTLDDEDLGADLLAHAKLLDSELIAGLITARYAELGIAVSVPDFSAYIDNFISTTSFPDTATVIDHPETGAFGPNLLFDTETPFDTTDQQSLAAEMPVDCLPLRIKIRAAADADCPSGCWAYDVTSVFNWDPTIYDFTENSQEFTSLDSSCDLAMFFTPGVYTVDFYENNSATPTRSQVFTVE